MTIDFSTLFTVPYRLKNAEKHFLHQWGIVLPTNRLEKMDKKKVIESHMGLLPVDNIFYPIFNVDNAREMADILDVNQIGASLCHINKSYFLACTRKTKDVIALMSAYSLFGKAIPMNVLDEFFQTINTKPDFVSLDLWELIGKVIKESLEKSHELKMETTQKLFYYDGEEK